VRAAGEDVPTRLYRPTVSGIPIATRTVWRSSGCRVDAVTRGDVLDFCGSLPGSVEDYPFGDGVAVFKIAGRMFALVSLEGDPGSVNLKCDPGLALELRARYSAVRPGYHQDKRHWNTVELDESIDDNELREMIDHSYGLVVNGLTRAQRALLSDG
jgi:predicted DNA-binding protein (MmcQ/YjbR family)